MWLQSDFSFEATLCAYNGTIIGLYEKRVVAIARHVYSFLGDSF